MGVKPEGMTPACLDELARPFAAAMEGLRGADVIAVTFLIGAVGGSDSLIHYETNRPVDLTLTQGLRRVIDLIELGLRPAEGHG